MSVLVVLAVCFAVDRATGASRRFGDWFTAERGAGEGKNGWV